MVSIADIKGKGETDTSGMLPPALDRPLGPSRPTATLYVEPALGFSAKVSMPNLMMLRRPETIPIAAWAMLKE